jgi:polyhydroxyalkanoate synthesis regulator phasin
MAQPRSPSQSGDGGHSREQGKIATPGIAGRAEQLANRLVNPFDLIVLTRDRLQETLDEAADRGRLTREDANELVAELSRRGRVQTEDLLGELEHLLDRGREQLGSATRRARRAEPVERIVRTADRARRGSGAGNTPPIAGYDELTVGQVCDRLGGLTAPQLRAVREYERRHANRKGVLSAVEKAL